MEVGLTTECYVLLTFFRAQSKVPIGPMHVCCIGPKVLQMCRRACLHHRRDAGLMQAPVVHQWMHLVSYSLHCPSLAGEGERNGLGEGILEGKKAQDGWSPDVVIRLHPIPTPSPHSPIQAAAEG